MGFKVKGLEDVKRSLNRLAQRAKELDGTQRVSFGDLFTASFMQEHSSFSSFNELLDAGGFNVNCPADFEAIPDEAFDAHIAQTTDFDDWHSMQEQAAADYVSRQLFDD